MSECESEGGRKGKSELSWFNRLNRSKQKSLGSGHTVVDIYIASITKYLFGLTSTGIKPRNKARLPSAYARTVLGSTHHHHHRASRARRCVNGPHGANWQDSETKQLHSMSTFRPLIVPYLKIAPSHFAFAANAFSRFSLPQHVSSKASAP